MTIPVLTIAMVVGGVASAYTAGVTGKISVEASKDVKSARDTSMLLAGIIKVTTLSVTVPVIMSFNVDMTKVPVSGTNDKTVNAQVEQPVDAAYKITSNSASSTQVYVAEITPGASSGSLPILTDTYVDVKTKGNSMLSATKDLAEASPAAETYSDPATEPNEVGTAAYWMTLAISSTDKYYLNPTIKGELIVEGLAVDVRADKGEAPLAVCTFTRKGWKVGDKFNVTPIFTVSVTDLTA